MMGPTGNTAHAISHGAICLVCLWARAGVCVCGYLNNNGFSWWPVKERAMGREHTRILTHNTHTTLSHTLELRERIDGVTYRPTAVLATLRLCVQLGPDEPTLRMWLRDCLCVCVNVCVDVVCAFCCSIARLYLPVFIRVRRLYGPRPVGFKCCDMPCRRLAEAAISCQGTLASSMIV